jgi:hypothetical protein
MSFNDKATLWPHIFAANFIGFERLTLASVLAGHGEYGVAGHRDGQSSASWPPVGVRVGTVFRLGQR